MVIDAMMMDPNYDPYKEIRRKTNPEHLKPGVVPLVDKLLYLADVFGAPSHAMTGLRDLNAQVRNVPIRLVDALYKLYGRSAEEEEARSKKPINSFSEAYKEADVNPSAIAKLLEYKPIGNTAANYSTDELAALYDLATISNGTPGQIKASAYHQKNKGYGKEVGGDFFDPYKVAEMSVGQTSGLKDETGPYLYDVFDFNEKDTKRYYDKAVKEGTATPFMYLRWLYGKLGSRGYEDGTSSYTAIPTKIYLDEMSNAANKYKTETNISDIIGTYNDIVSRGVEPKNSTVKPQPVGKRSLKRRKK